MAGDGHDCLVGGHDVGFVVVALGLPCADFREVLLADEPLFDGCHVFAAFCECAGEHAGGVGGGVGFPVVAVVVGFGVDGPCGGVVGGSVDFGVVAVWDEVGVALEEGEVGQGDAGVVGVADEGFRAVVVSFGVSESAGIVTLGALGGQQFVEDLRWYRAVGAGQCDGDEVRAPVHGDAVLHAWGVVVDVAGELDPQVSGVFAEEVGGILAENFGGHDHLGQASRVLVDVLRAGFLEGCGHFCDGVGVGV